MIHLLINGRPENKDSPSPVVIKVIEEFLIDRGVPPEKSIEAIWVDCSLYEKVAIRIVYEYLVSLEFFVKTLRGREPQHLPTQVFEDDKVISHFNQLRDDADMIIQGMCEPHKSELKKALTTGMFLGKKIPWHESTFMPIVMKYFFLFVNDFNELKSKVSLARFNAWYNYEVGKVFLKEDEEERDSITEFKGVQLRSPGHKKLCNRLAEMGYMFFFEAPCILLGDKCRKRFIDLVVIANNRAVIVEIDGGTHRNKEQQRDDNLRDHLIGQNWTNRIRIEHTDAMEKTEEMVSRIISYLDPDKGRIA